MQELLIEVYMRINWGVILICLVCCILVTSWYKPGYIIGGGEESLSFLFPERTAQYYQFTWEQINTGGVQTIELSRYPLFYLLGSFSKLGVPSDFLQILVFFTLLAISGVAVYYLISESLTSKYAGTIGAIFYLLNSFMFASIWHRYLLAMVFMMALLPVSIYCLDRIIKTKSLIYLGIFLMANLSLSSAFSLPSNVITYWVVLVLYILARLVCKTSFFDIFKLIGWGILFCIVWLLTSAWWIAPIYLLSTERYSTIFSSEQNISILRSLSSQYGLLNNLLLGYGGVFNEWHLMISVIGFFCIFLGLLKFPVSYWRVFLILLLVGSLFMLNGSNMPTGWLFEIIFDKVFFLQAFRNPYEKFGIVLVIVYTWLFSSSALYIYKKYDRTGVLAIMLLILVWLIPPWTGFVFGNKDYNVYVKVPQDYTLVNSLLNTDTDQFRVLHMPISPGDGLSYQWKDPYFGYSPNKFLFDKPAMDKIVRQKDQDNYWWLLRQGLYTGQLGELSKYSNIKYLIQHKDLNSIYSQTDEYTTTREYLEEQIIYDGNNEKLVCANMSGRLDVPLKLLDIHCPVSGLTKDQIFIRVSAEVNTSGAFEVDLVDGGQHLIFDGRVEDWYYQKNNNGNNSISLVLDTRIPTYKYPNFKLADATEIIIRFYPDNSELHTYNLKILEVLASKGSKRKEYSWDLIFSTSNIDLYKLKSDLFKPLVYPVSKIEVIDDWTALKSKNIMPDAFVFKNQISDFSEYKFESTEIPTIKWEKINNTKYMLNITDQKMPFWLVFSETYAPGWILKQSEHEFRHFKVNGFLNGYYIEPLLSENLILEFNPQIMTDRMKTVSYIVAIIILVAIIIQILWKIKAVTQKN